MEEGVDQPDSFHRSRLPALSLFRRWYCSENIFLAREIRVAAALGEIPAISAISWYGTPWAALKISAIAYSSGIFARVNRISSRSAISGMPPESERKLSISSFAPCSPCSFSRERPDKGHQEIRLRGRS